MKVSLQERIEAPQILPQMAAAVFGVMAIPDQERARVLAAFSLSDLAITTWHGPVRRNDARDCQKIAEALATIQALLPGLSQGTLNSVEAHILAPGSEDWTEEAKALDGIKAREAGWHHFRDNLARWRAVFADQARSIDKAADRGEVAHHRLNHEALTVCHVALKLWGTATGQNMNKAGPSATNPFIEFLATVLEITGTAGEAEHVYDSYRLHPWPEGSDTEGE